MIPDLDNYRWDEIDSANSTGDYTDIQALFNKSKSLSNESFINIGRTLYIMILLLIGSYIFNHDATKLVLQPIEELLR